MKCKPCGRPLHRSAIWWTFFKECKVLEPLCQTCRGWLATGRVYDVR